MYPIDIKEGKKNIREDFKYPLKGTWVTLEMLREHINEGEYFTIVEDEVEGDSYILVNRDRLETDEEQEKRVTREKTYMENYNKYHNK